MSEVKQDRLVRESFITRILENLKNWMPFRKTTEKIDFVVGSEEKKVLTLQANGELLLITDLTNNTVESLQNKLSKIGLTFVDNEEEFTQFISNENVGKYVYLNTSSETYTAGLYYIIINASNHGNIEPKLLGQDIKTELTNYYKKEEVDNYLLNYVKKEELTEDIEGIVIKQINEIISTDEDGNVSINLEGYVTIEEFNNRISIIEDWAGITDSKSGAITIDEIEQITQLDLDNNGKINLE